MPTPLPPSMKKPRHCHQQQTEITATPAAVAILKPEQALSSLQRTLTATDALSQAPGHALSQAQIEPAVQARVLSTHSLMLNRSDAS